MRRCARCGEEKGREQFNRRAAAKAGVQAYCKSCQREYAKAHRPLAEAGVLAAYGGACQCCGESRVEFLGLFGIAPHPKEGRNRASLPSYRGLLGQARRILRDEERYRDKVREAQEEGLPDVMAYWGGRFQRVQSKRASIRVFCVNCQTLMAREGSCPHAKMRAEVRVLHAR